MNKNSFNSDIKALDDIIKLTNPLVETPIMDLLNTDSDKLASYFGQLINLQSKFDFFVSTDLYHSLVLKSYSSAQMMTYIKKVKEVCDMRLKLKHRISCKDAILQLKRNIVKGDTYDKNEYKFHVLTNERN